VLGLRPLAAVIELPGLGLDRVGRRGDWTILRNGFPESGGNGRKIRMGMLRNASDGGRRRFEMRR
jgi:hypothetical protein